uniref:Uncharacterized protein n=1 Tax=Panagrolaimus davidi TaxID=227884 RepID=A0A914Q0E8_9BILA
MSVESTASGTSRRSSRARRTPSSHNDYVRSDRVVRFDLAGSAGGADNQEGNQLIPGSSVVAFIDDYDPTDFEFAERPSEEEDQTLDSDVPPKRRASSSADQSIRKRPKKSSLQERRDIVNPPDLYFVGKCGSCVFAASYFDVTSNGVVMAGSTVSLPVYGQASVIYDKIEQEETAQNEAKQYAQGMGLQYGAVDGRFIVFTSPAPTIIAGPNDDRVFDLEQENRRLRLEMAALRENYEGRLSALERFRDDILNGRIPVAPAVNQLTTEAAVNVEPPVMPQSPPQPLARRVIALPQIADAPNWSILTEDAARGLREQFENQSAFIRSVYKHIFTDTQTFQNNLPPAAKLEYEKICMALLGPTTAADIASTRKAVEAEFKYQKGLLRTRITAPKTLAVAMVTSAIPLRKNGQNIWEPLDNSVRFEYARAENVRTWPLLIHHGRPADTMFAERKHTGSGRSSWSYFIITHDGVLIPCSKE